MKVLFCSPRQHVGGISRWTNNILSYYAGCCCRDLDIEWYYPGSSKNETLASTGMIRRVWNAIVSYVPLICGLGRKLKKSRPSIVHFSTSASLGLLRDYITTGICRRYSIPTALHYHFGRIPELISSNSWEGRLLRKIAERVDVNIVMDRMSYEAMRANGYTNVEFLPNPLSLEVESLVEKYRNIPTKARTVIFIGHMVPSKGIYELVEACKGIPDVKVKMLGAVSEDVKSKLLNTGGSEASKWLDIQGVQPYEKVIEELMRSSILVLPSYTEGFPNVIIESMACGKACVSTPVGAISDMLNVDSEYTCGICVTVRDVNSLRSAIIKLLDNPDLSKQMGRNGYNRAQTCYTMAVVFEKLSRIWKKNSA